MQHQELKGFVVSLKREREVRDLEATSLGDAAVVSSFVIDAPWGLQEQVVVQEVQKSVEYRE